MGTTDADFRREVLSGLIELADAERAVGQQAYMKSAMPYHGVVMADVRRVVRDVLRKRPLPSARTWQKVVLRLWRDASHREQRHAAIEVLVAKAHAQWLRLERLSMVEEMVVTGAWWDYVDALAINAVGPILRAAPAEMKPLLLGWAKGDDVWKRRSAILAQIKFKAATDEAFLAAAIAPSLGNREFFLAKAIGWALRQHSRTNPAFVVDYVAMHKDQLVPLSKREGLKVLLKEGVVDEIP